MSTLTVHGVEEDLDRRVREIARQEKTSINRAVRSLLRQSLGLDVTVEDHRAEFLDVAGSWSQADLEAFESTTAGFSKIDPADWT